MAHLSEQDRLKLRKRITSYSGLGKPIQSNRALDQAVDQCLDVLGLAGFDDYWQLLQRGGGDDEEMNHLVRLLTNKDTYFFREMPQFEVLRDQILPEVLAAREHPLRIWSAGCATGEEPYSLAMALLAYQARHGVFEVSIVATDIDAPALAAARRARYGQRAVRQVPDDLLKRYFSFDGQSYHLVPEAAELVTFEVHNLAKDDLTPGLEHQDLVFCRNVTTYFAEWARDRVNALLADSLREGGYLFVASAETTGHNLGRLEQVSIDQTALFRKPQPPAMPSSALPPSLLDRLDSGERLPAPDSQPGAPLTRKGRLVRASREKAAGLPGEGKGLRRPSPDSLEELVAQAQARARAWSQRPSSREPQDAVHAGSRDPDRDHAILERARTAFQQQEFEVALGELDQLPAGVPVWSAAYCLRSAILVQQERFEEAESVCQTMLAHDPWYADAHFMLGLVFRQQGQVDEAVRSLEQAIYLEPNHRYAHFYLAEIHRGLGWMARARSEYEATLDILEQLDEPSSELSLAGLDDDALRRACETILEAAPIGPADRPAGS